MSGWQFSFPQSRSCLWDGSPVGECTELFVTRNSWLRVQLSVPSLQLAVRHARQSSRKPFDCFLIATAWITENEGILLEVDRFDPGRLPQGRENIVPTALIPGDVPIPCQVVVGCHPLAKHLTHNLVNLSEAFESLEQHISRHPCPLDPSLLLSLRIHLGCASDGSLNVRCGCVSPAVVCEATPIRPIPIVQTALARNLSGPLPLSTLQGRVKHGYITMDSTRKLVLLLHSDPKATQLPLVGVWVSGIGSVHHPQVWTACVSYTKSSSLSDRVWWEDNDDDGGGGDGGRDGSFLLLVYVQGTTQPSFWQCSTKTGRDGLMGTRNIPFEIASGDTSIQASLDVGLVSMELFPAQESSALKTLLEAMLKSSTANLNEISCDLPTPSPKPTPTMVPQRPVRDSELSMLSSLSLPDRPSLNTSQHSIASTTSPLPTTIAHSSSTAPPSHLHTSDQVQVKNTATTTPSFNGATRRKVDQHDLHVHVGGEGKENISPPHPNKATEATTSSHTGDGSLVVFPEKQLVNTKSDDAPSPSTQELLRQQELQLRVLQEQVNSLLRLQSANSSPLTRDQSSTPKAEAGTNTGQSLFWHNTPTATPTSSQYQNLSSTNAGTTTTAATTEAGSQCDDENSVCSSGMADLSVSMQTATSILSQGVSEMHLDLQSYTDSPTSSRSHSFGESASMAGYRAEGSSHESSPASLLFRDQHQFYQNMLAQVNDLIQSQQQSQASDGSNTDPESCSDSSTPKCSPELQRSQQQQPSRDQDSNADLTGTSGYSGASRQSQHKNQVNQSDGAVAPVSTQISHNSGENQPHNVSNSEHIQPVLKYPYTPVLVLDQSLPPLHPDVLQQKFTGDISMLPVPRIMYSGSSGRAGGTVATTFMSHLGGADFTLDENMQMADMIALKYLGKKNELNATSDYDMTGGEGLVSVGGGSERTMAHMSMATRQYLEKHNLIKAPQTAAGGREGMTSRSGERGETRKNDTERILDVQRLKTLPKLI